MHFRYSNGIAGGANNRFAPLERDLLSYCDCKRHLCVNMGKVWAACYCMSYGNGHQRAKCLFCTLLPHLQYSYNIVVYVDAPYAVFLLFFRIILRYGLDDPEFDSRLEKYSFLPTVQTWFGIHPWVPG